MSTTDKRTDAGMSRSWSTDSIQDTAYRTKFIDVPNVISDWLRDHGGLKGRDVLDFGCGEAATALGIALLHGVRRIVGIDIHGGMEKVLTDARVQLGLEHLPDNLEVRRVEPDEPLDSIGLFDVAYSWSVFERVRQDIILDSFIRIRRVLRPDGVMFLQTTPLFYSAEGSHLMPWAPWPWAHLTMQQDRLYAALRSGCENREQADHLQWVYETLNRTTAPALLRAVNEAGFDVVREYRTHDEHAVPEELKEIYTEEVLTTNQLVFLAKVRSSSSVYVPAAPPPLDVESEQSEPPEPSVHRSSSDADSQLQVVGTDKRPMKALEEIWKDRRYVHEISYTRNLGLMLQPGSFTDFKKHPDFMEAFRLWTQRDPFRGLDLVRLWSLVLNVKHVLTRCTGSLAEVGVYQGQAAAVLSCYAKRFGRKIYLADTFQGFPEQQFEEGMSDAKKEAFKDTTLESARSVVGNYTGNRWVVGVFPDSVTEEMHEDAYAFVSIDCDIYEPISEGLKFFWPRMVPDGMIFIHDYSSGYWPGATRAVDEFCKLNGAAGCLLPDLAGSYILIKQNPSPVSAAFSEAEQTRPQRSQRFESLDPSPHETQRALIRARAEIAELEDALRRIQASRSWRVTKPLRTLRAWCTALLNFPRR